MNAAQYLKNLNVPDAKVDLVLDTDTFNEVDDQFAIAYLLASPEKLNLKALYAAPFYNHHSESPGDGMLKSYEEIHRLLELADRREFIPVTYKGSESYLPDENTPVPSPAAEDLVKRAGEYSAQNPLYVVAIGAITNIASALLQEPSIAERIVIVWLGGKNPLCDFLVGRVKEEIDRHMKNRLAVSRVLWDVAAVAWLLNDNDRFMLSRLASLPIPEYDGLYAYDQSRFIRYVYHINRDSLASDLFSKLAIGSCKH